METRIICIIGQNLMCWLTFDFLNIDNFVGIFIVLKLGSSYGMYFGTNEKTELGSLISIENVLLV